MSQSVRHPPEVYQVVAGKEEIPMHPPGMKPVACQLAEEAKMTGTAE